MARETIAQRELREAKDMSQRQSEAFLAEIKRTGVISTEWRQYLTTLMMAVQKAAWDHGRAQGRIEGKDEATGKRKKKAKVVRIGGAASRKKR